MARKRMLDPGIWDSEQVMSLSCAQFKLYIYLISQADDEGRVKVSVPLFRSRIHPLTDYSIDDTAADLSAIAECGLVRLYQVNGDTYLHHPNWHIYQKINRPTDSKYPFSEDSVSAHGGLTPNRIEENRIEENISEVTGDEAPEAPPPKPERKKKATDERIQPLIRYYFDKYQERAGEKPSVTGQWGATFKRLLRIHDDETIRKVIDFFFACDKRLKFGFTTFTGKFDDLLPGATGHQARASPYSKARCPHCGRVLDEGHAPDCPTRQAKE